MAMGEDTGNHLKMMSKNSAVDSKLTCPVYVAHDLSWFPSSDFSSGALDLVPGLNDQHAPNWGTGAFSAGDVIGNVMSAPGCASPT